MKDKKIETIITDIHEEIDLNRAVQNLSKAIQIPTISSSEYSSVDWTKFEEFIEFVTSAYPNVTKKMKRRRINKYSLLYKWEGKDPSKKPVLLMGHMDVVPIEDGTNNNWKHAPFSGHIDDEYLWGRGTLDIKIQVISILEAAETLLQEGFVPPRDIYFAFGHDEESGGENGAAKIAEVLKEEKIVFEYILDEGGCISENGIPLAKRPLALVGICEKGYLNVKLEAQGKAGHSSVPSIHTSLGDIANAIVKIEKKPFKKKITKPLRIMMTSLAPYLEFKQRIIIRNLWIFASVFKSSFGKSDYGRALLHTTIAATMAKASDEPNVLPQKAEAVLNCRPISGQSCNDVIEYIKKVIKNEEINITVLIADEASKVSKIDTEGFELIKRNINAIEPNVPVIPYLMVGGTDCLKYQDMSDSVYRFTPYHIDNREKESIHGTNERISIENIKKCVIFFKRLMQEK